MDKLAFLTLAALLEVGGDGLVRWGLKDGRVLGFVLGAIVVFAYGMLVNMPKWDFGRLLGVYIAVFFVVSQFIAILVFREVLRIPTLVAGAFIVAGGLILTFWRV